jgi:hypothetical protein
VVDLFPGENWYARGERGDVGVELVLAEEESDSF